MSDTETPPQVRCRIWPGKCPNPATLVVYGGGDCLCSPCDMYDGVCQGHEVCDEHGATLRIKELPQLPSRPEASPPFVVTRIHTLAEGATA